MKNKSFIGFLMILFGVIIFFIRNLFPSSLIMVPLIIAGLLIFFGWAIIIVRFGKWMSG